MDAKKYLIVGGSSGIGFEIVNELSNRGDDVYVGSRTSDKLTGLRGVHYLKLDVAQPPDLLEGLPEALHGVAYCLGTIRLKPFQRLTREDFLEDLQVNYQEIIDTFCLQPAGAAEACKARPENDCVESLWLHFTFPVNVNPNLQVRECPH